MANKHTKEELQELQALPLKVKIMKTKLRIREWVNEFGLDGVYISFSGGLDSTILLHIAREMYSDKIKAVFSNTGLEFPETVKFVKTFPNVDIVRPELTYTEVIKKYGYPLISKEVSECVYAARKCFQSIIKDNNFDGKWHYQKFRQLCGIGEYRKNINNGGGGDDLDKLPLLAQKAFLLDSEKSINSWRVQEILGIITRDGLNNELVIHDEIDRSRFSFDRYKFLIDAPFEIGKQCCDYLKKSPLKKYQKEFGTRPILATMASESRLRTQQWIKQGCNAFEAKDKKSAPMSFWLKQDALEYIYINKQELLKWRKGEYENNLKQSPFSEIVDYKKELDSIISPINSVYGDVVIDYESMGQVEGQMDFNDLGAYGVFDFNRPIYKTTGADRTGCFGCAYGQHHENCKEKSRIQTIIDFSNPNLADWMLRGGHFRDSDGMWEPYKGLGMAFIYEWCNCKGNINYWYPNREYYLSQLPDECWKYL